MANNRFWSKVDKGEDDVCWPWLSYIMPNGYGRYHPAVHVSILAHRYAYTEIYGEIPKGLVIMHTCDNPPCCNPKHLRLGTQADNLYDARMKMRLWARLPLQKKEV